MASAKRHQRRAGHDAVAVENDEGLVVRTEAFDPIGDVAGFTRRIFAAAAIIDRQDVGEIFAQGMIDVGLASALRFPARVGEHEDVEVFVLAECL